MVLYCADVDDCAAGGIAYGCTVNGTCDGLYPPGSFTCTCNIGYQLRPDNASCEGKLDKNLPFYCHYAMFIRLTNLMNKTNPGCRTQPALANKFANKFVGWTTSLSLSTFMLGSWVGQTC